MNDTARLLCVSGHALAYVLAVAVPFVAVLFSRHTGFTKRTTLLIVALMCCGAVFQILADDKSAQNGSCGPSVFSVAESIRLMAVTAWPPLIAFWSWRRWRRRSIPLAIWTQSGILLLLAVYASLLLFLTGWSHEDTVTANGFSTQGWYGIRQGMTRAQVYERIGVPLDAEWQPGAAVWARPQTAGHFAVVWFSGDVVKEAHIWSKD